MFRENYIRESYISYIPLIGNFFCVVILGLKNVNLNNLSL